MKSVAYIITRENISELLEENILAPILKNEHGAPVAVFYFVGDGAYHLIKGSRNAKNIKAIMKMGQTAIYACEASIKNRKLQNIILDGVKFGTLKDFYNAASNVDYIISF
ncbi:MAG: DsrE family protein [bacterium]|nr:MAG: DsrE family protein [bacterium]